MPKLILLFDVFLHLTFVSNPSKPIVVLVLDIFGFRPGAQIIESKRDELQITPLSRLSMLGNLLQEQDTGLPRARLT